MPPERTASSTTKRKTSAFKPPSRTNTNTKTSNGEPSTARSKSKTSTTTRPAAINVDAEDDPVGDESLPPASQDQTPTIPAKLLTRLIHEHFEDDRTKITKEASQAMQKYMEVFVREALARAAYERRESGVARRGDAFLEVEDLEKLAPQLLLDF